MAASSFVAVAQHFDNKSAERNIDQHHNLDIGALKAEGRKGLNNISNLLFVGKLALDKEAAAGNRQELVPAGRDKALEPDLAPNKAEEDMAVEPLEELVGDDNNPAQLALEH